MSEVEKKETRENYSFKKKIFKNIRNKHINRILEIIKTKILNLDIFKIEDITKKIKMMIILKKKMKKCI